MLSEDVASRFAKLRRSRSTPNSQQKARTIENENEVGVLRLRGLSALRIAASLRMTLAVVIPQTSAPNSVLNSHQIQPTGGRGGAGCRAFLRTQDPLQIFRPHSSLA